MKRTKCEQEREAFEMFIVKVNTHGFIKHTKYPRSTNLLVHIHFNFLRYGINSIIFALTMHSMLGMRHNFRIQLQLQCVQSY